MVRASLHRKIGNDQRQLQWVLFTSLVCGPLHSKLNVVSLRKIMATGCQPSFDDDEELVGFSDDQRENVDGIESVENSATRGIEGAFVLNVDAGIMQIGRQNDVSFDSVDFQNSDSKTKRSDEGGPVLREHWSPTGRLSVGRSRSGFPDCKHDHLVQLVVCKNHHTREALDITDKYNVTTTVTYDGNNDTAFQMPDYQCKRIKSETKSGVSRTMAGIAGFLFRFHEPNTKYKINFTLKTALPKRRVKKKVEKENSACETISEISITLETGSRSIWKSVKPREKTKARIIPPSFELGPASLSKTNTELCKRSVWVVNQLQSQRNDGKWDDFDNSACDLLLKFPDADTQITIKLEQSVAALYRNDFERSLQFIDESFELMPQATNVQLLAGRGYGYRAGVARRQKNLGEAATFMQLAEQNSHACHTDLDTSYIAYEKASVLLDFIGLSPQRSLNQVREALSNLEKCIELCMRLEKEDNELKIQRHHFAFIKIAMLLLDCRTDAARERVLSEEFIAKGEECLNTLKTKYLEDSMEAVKIQFNLASSDLEYRKGNFVEAEGFASLAKDMAEDLGFKTEISLAQDRLNHTRVLARVGRSENNSRLSPSLVSASEGEIGDVDEVKVNSSGSESVESDSLQIFE